MPGHYKGRQAALRADLAAESGDIECQIREARIRTRMESGDLQNAAAEAVKLYGSEILRFLRVRLRARELADDAFSAFCEDLWVGLPNFAWRSTLRTWSFVLARNAASEQIRRARRDRRCEAHDTSGAFATVCDRVRTETLDYLRTGMKQRV